MKCMKQKTNVLRHVTALMLALVMVFSLAFVNAEGLLNASAAGSFTFNGTNAAKFKGEKTFVVGKNVSTKMKKALKTAYNKNQKSFAKVNKVEFGDKVTVVKEDVLAFFPNVKTIVIGKNVADFPEAKWNASYSGITNSLEKFAAIQVKKGNDNYSAKAGILYNKKKTKLVKIPQNYNKTSYSMPDTVTGLASDDAIANCSKLVSFQIGKNYEGSLKKLSTMPKLSTITVVAGNTEYTALDGVLYSADQTRLICWPSARQDTIVSLPDTVKSLNLDMLPKTVSTLTIPRDTTNVYSDDTDNDTYGKRYALNVLTNLSSVAVADGNQNFVVEGNILYNSKKTMCYGIPAKSSVTEISLPEGIVNIYYNLFYNHPTITKIHLPSTVVMEGGGNTAVFGGDNTLVSLTAYTVAEENQSLKAVDGVLYSKDGKDLICYPIAKAGAEFVVPDEVENIYENALSNQCTALTKLTFGKGVKALGNNGINLPNLTEYQVVDENATFCARDGVLYTKSMNAICGYPKKKPDKSFTVQNSIEDIAYYGVFANDFLKELDLQGAAKMPSWLTMSLPKLESFSTGDNDSYKVKNGVLYDYDMEEIYYYPPAKDTANFIVPDTVKEIDEDAILNNPYLKKVVLGKKVKYISSQWFGYGCKKLAKVEVNKSNKYFTAKSGVLYNKKVTSVKAYPYGKKGKTFVIPKTVSSFDINSNFMQKTKVKKFKLEKGNKTLTTDGKNVYYKKKKTPSLTLDKSLAIEGLYVNPVAVW